MLGKVCVSIFLLLSGYGLTIQMKKLVTNSGGEIRGGGTNTMLLAEKIHKVLSQLLGDFYHLCTNWCVLLR